MNLPVLMRDCPAENSKISVAVVVLEGVSLTTVSTTLDPFHLVNNLLGANRRFEISIASLSGNDPVTQIGIPIPCTDSAFDICDRSVGGLPDLVVVCGGQSVFSPRDLKDFLRRLRRMQCRVFAMGAAAAIAAGVGLIKQQRCSVHWKSMAALAEQFPGLDWQQTLYSSDGRVASCAGELAAFDLIVGFIEEVCGPKVAAEVCSQFLSNGKRSGEVQQLLHGDTLICGDEKFQLAIEIMMENMEYPVSGKELARRLGISTRQVQRIFAKNGFDSPLKYYQNLRLVRAQQLIEQTRMSLTEIGLACGFKSSNAFRRCYKRKFNVTPNQTRNRSRQQSLLDAH